MPAPDHVVFLNGSYGVGKSTTLEHVGDLLADAGRSFSLMDVDWFHRSWPTSAHDPENVLVEADNLAAVWSNYLCAGPRQPVVAGVLASEDDQQRYARAFGRPVRSVRLVARPAVAEARLRSRYIAHQQRALDWHLARHVRLQEELAASDLDELVVDTDDLDARSVATLVLRHFELLAPA